MLQAMAYGNNAAGIVLDVYSTSWVPKQRLWVCHHKAEENCLIQSFTAAAADGEV